MLAPAALSLLTTAFSHPDERGRAFGVYGGIATAGGPVGLLADGALTQYLNWRWTMFVNVAIAGIVIAGGVIFLSSRLTQARQRADRAGAVLGAWGCSQWSTGLPTRRRTQEARDGPIPRRSARSRPASCYWPPS